MRVSITRPMPQELIQALAELGVLSASLQSSNLPPGLSFELLLDFGQGRLTGQVPDQPGLYQLIYSLTDARQCVVGQLYVLITVGEPTTTPGPTGPACPEAQLLTWEYGEVKGGTLHFFTLRQMPPALLSQIQAAGAQEAELLSSGLPQGWSSPSILRAEPDSYRGTCRRGRPCMRWFTACSITLVVGPIGIR